MKTQRIFDNIMDQFNSDEEEENEEVESQRHSEENKKHKKSSSLAGNSNNMQDKIFNTNREIVKNAQTKKRKKNEFGYFINDEDENNEEENEENENDNENEEKADSEENKDEEESSNKDKTNISIQKKEDGDEFNVNNSQNEEKEENDDSNNNENNNEEENDNNNDNENNDYNNDNENEQNYDDNNTNENEFKEEIKESEVKKNEEINVEEEHQEKNDEETDIINELYNKNKNQNLEQSEGEPFRMGSFRPNPIPGSPKFSKRISKNVEESLIKNEDKNTSNNISNNNNNLTNFTEKIETKIEGDKIIPNKEENSVNNYIPKFTHDNDIVSLGKISKKEINNINNNNINDSLIQKNNINNKVIEEHQNKSNEAEIKAEEDFLKREELKMQKKKESLDINNNKEKVEEKQNISKINNKKFEEEGKENVTEDEEEDPKNKINIISSKNENKNDTIPSEIKEDSKEIYSSVNSTSENNNNIKKNNNIDINEIKVRELSTEVLGNSQNSSVEHSHKNSGSKNKINSNNNKNIAINRNIYSKKIAPDRNNNNNKKNNQMNMPKKEMYESPYDKSYKKNNTNYSSDNNQNISSNKNISPFNYNNISNRSKKINIQRKNEMQDKAKNLYQIKENKPNFYENNSKKNNNNNNIQEKFPFKPQIDENSQKMYEKKLSNNKNEQPNQDNQTIPLSLLLLYEDGSRIQEKIHQEYIRQNNNIIANANKKKINDNSYNMVNNRLNKKIDNAINKFVKKFEEKIEDNKEGKNEVKLKEKYMLNIVSMTQCLYELNIINELIKPKDNIKDINLNNQLDLAELQSMAESVNKRDIKKSEELELIEQLYYLLNPKLNTYFECDILSIFLKLFFCGNYTPKELEDCIISLLEKYKISNLEKSGEYKSPLRNKIYEKNQIWSLAQFIKVFLNLKKNLKAYRENDYTKGDVYNNIIKESEKDLTFEPNFEASKYFYKYSNFKYNKDNSIIDLINKFKNNDQKTKHDFNKVYERFKAKKEFQEKTLQRIREIQEENELKMCTNVPKINKYRPTSKSHDKNNSKEEEKNLQKNKSFIKEPRYKLLYGLRKKFDKNEKVHRVKEDDILDENCTFKPKISSNIKMSKSFSNIKNREKPKGFNDYVNRNRSFIKSKELEKKLEEDKKYGRGYDKLQKLKIKPLNMTFLEASNSKKKNNIKYIKTDTNHKNRYNLESEKNDNIIDNIYITLDIKIKNGAIKPLKIYNKKDKKIIDDINNFCRIYSLNEEVKKTLIKKALKYKYNLFGNNLDNNKEGFMIGEDLDTITKAYSNDGNI